MTDKEEIEAYQETLNNGLYILCQAISVDPERYDTDQADFECYMNFFREVAELIKRVDYKFDDETGEFVSEYQQVKKKASLRGARMQIMSEWIYEHNAEIPEEFREWFDSDGVPE